MNRQINHKAMRRVIGAIAFLLAPLAYILADTSNKLSSISISYWTNAGDVFVGALVVVGFFLFAYNGTGEGKDWEYWLSKIACPLAICVALFPTAGFDGTNVPPTWTSVVSGLFGLKPYHIHYGAAIPFFGCLVAMMWFFSNRAMKKGKETRAYIYRAIAVLMIAGVIPVFFLAPENMKVLFMEWWELTLFGAGWWLAGSYKTDPNV